MTRKRSRPGRRPRDVSEYADATSLQHRSDRAAFCDDVSSREFWRVNGPEQDEADRLVVRALGRVSLTEAAAILGVSKERARVVEANALRKLRALLEGSR